MEWPHPKKTPMLRFFSKPARKDSKPAEFPSMKPWWQKPGATLLVNLLISGILIMLLAASQLSRLQTPSTPSAELLPDAGLFGSLDSLNSSDIALSLATMGHFREQAWVEIQAYNSRALLTPSAGGLPVVPKPAVIDSTVRTRADIAQYVIAEGDTVLSLANDFNVSSGSIRWSNDVRGNFLRGGETIVIPPPGLNGIVHRIAIDDTLRSLGGEYNFSARSLQNFNDLESLDDLPVGELIFLPNATPATIENIPVFLAKAIDSERAYVTSSQIANCYGCEPVDTGDIIGKLGNTGWSTGAHLHLEIITYDGRAHNPWAFINQNNLIWPVDQVQRRVTQVYHSGHRGLDVGDSEGTAVFALEPGEIIHRGCMWEESRIWATFGVIIDHGNYYSLYIHLQAPNNELYARCSINRRSNWGAKSIDYSISR